MMALNIPNAPGVLESLLQGINTGGGLYSKLMQPILSREELAQKAKQHEDEMALRRAALARSGANADIQRQLLQQQLLSAQHANDPMYAFNQYKTLQDMFGGKASASGAPSELEGQGMGVFSPEGLSNEQAMGGNAGSSGGIDLELLKQNPILRGFFKHQFGYDPLAETPQEKRQAEFQEKENLENLKNENKSKALQDKELMSVEKDLPALEKSLKGIQRLKEIALNNPDMFGHGFMPDRFAKTTKIKDFGEWQNLISDAIAGLEQKLSSRGNIVALKMASQLKPSHAEQQNVALGKLDSMEKQLNDTINNSYNKLGKERKSSVNTDLSKLSDEELKNIISGAQ
jgi:hypothetical protein